MPSITGIESKITEVLKHVPDDLDTQARFSELRINMVRFKSDIETREQAERRIVVVLCVLLSAWLCKEERP